MDRYAGSSSEERALEIQEELQAYVSEFPWHYALGEGLLLWGPPGTGKTGLICAVMNLIYEFEKSDGTAYTGRYYTLEGLRRLNISEIKLSQALGTSNEAYEEWKDRRDRISKLRNKVDVLAIDDVGKEHHTASGFAEDDFEYVLRRRFDLALPTLMTSNVNPVSWDAVYHPSISSFLNDCCAYVIEVNTEPLR